MKPAKYLRAIALLSLCVAMALSLCGCGNSGAKKKITSDVTERLEAIVAGDYSSLAYLAAGLEAEDLAEYGVEESELLAAFLEEFAYEVGSISVSGSTATVSVVLTCKSYLEFYRAFEEAVYDIPLDNSDATESELAELFEEAIYDAIAEADTTQVTVVLTYEKIDKTWSPTSDYEQLLANALLAG